MRNFGIPQVRSSARILLVCPDCGHENTEFAERLQAAGMFYCTGEGCDYIFALDGGRGRTFSGFMDAVKSFYAAFYAMRGQRAR
jgi:hypothetical protein